MICDRCHGNLGAHYVSLRARLICLDCIPAAAAEVSQDPKATPRDRARAVECKLIADLWGAIRAPLAALALAVFASGCAGPTPKWDGNPASCPGVVESGTCYVASFGTMPPMAKIQAARATVEATWGAGVLHGWLVTLDAPGACQHSPYACAYPEQEIVAVNDFPCAIGWIIHEAGHAVFYEQDGGGDRSHLSPRWVSADAITRDFLAKCATGAFGE